MFVSMLKRAQGSSFSTFLSDAFSRVYESCIVLAPNTAWKMVATFQFRFASHLCCLSSLREVLTNKILQDALVKYNVC